MMHWYTEIKGKPKNFTDSSTVFICKEIDSKALKTVRPKKVEIVNQKSVQNQRNAYVSLEKAYDKHIQDVTHDRQISPPLGLGPIDKS